MPYGDSAHKAEAYASRRLSFASRRAERHEASVSVEVRFANFRRGGQSPSSRRQVYRASRMTPEVATRTLEKRFAPEKGRMLPTHWRIRACAPHDMSHQTLQTTK